MKAVLEHEPLLIFRVGPVVCCVPVRDVDSIVVPQPLSSMPGQAAFIAGVFHYRQHTVSVVDVFHKFGLPTPESKHGRVIMAYTRHGMVGYWVDEIYEITSGYDNDFRAPPSFIGGNIFDKTLLWRDKLVLNTNFENLYAMEDAAPLQSWIGEHKQTLEHQQRQDTEIGEKRKPKQREEREPKSAEVVSLDEAREHSKPTNEEQVEKEKTAVNEVTQPEPAIEAETAETSLEEVPAQQSVETEIEAEISEPVVELEEEKKNPSAFASPKTAASTEQKIQPERPGFNAKTERTEFSTRSAISEAPRVVIPKDIRVDPAKQELSSAQAVKPDATPDIVTAQAVKPIRNEKTFSLAQASHAEPAETKPVAKSDELPEAASDTIAQQNTSLGLVNLSELEKEGEKFNTSTFGREGDGNSIKWIGGVLGVVLVGAGALYLSTRGDHEVRVPDKVQADIADKAASHSVAEVTHVEVETHDESPREDEIVARFQDQATQAHSEILAGDMAPVAQHDLTETDPALTQLPGPVAVTTEPHLVLEEVVPPLKPKNGAPAPTPVWGIHIVVRGDTLWHLADRYLSNPYLYSDLAKWSNISNPDLIYPGDNIHYKNPDEK